MIVLSPKQIVKFLFFVIVGLATASLFSQFLDFYLGDDMPYGIADRLYVDKENSIPTWYASITLLFCSILLFVITLSKRLQSDRQSYFWGGLSLIFLYLSVDESASLHELLNHVMAKLAPHQASLISQPWVILGAMIVLIFGAIYLKFVLSLPKKTRNLFITSFGLYVGGAVLMEVMSSLYWDSVSSEPEIINHVVLMLMITLEEIFEMLGLLVFIYALLDYIRIHIHRVQILVQDQPIELAHSNTNPSLEADWTIKS